MSDSKKILSEKFSHHFNLNPTHFFSSPGRMEVLGNHTDYNHGLCLAAAIDYAIEAAVSVNDSFIVHAISRGTRYPFRVNLRYLEVDPRQYNRSEALIRGVANGFVKRGFQIGGLNLYAISSIPRGAGVSSSAAFELLIATAFNHMFNQGKIDPTTLAQIAHEAEVDYFNKPCGLLDQTAVAYGGLVYLDFHSTETPLVEKIDFSINDYDIILVNTGSHSKLTSYYAETRDDIQKVAAYFSLPSLREVNYADFINNLHEIFNKLGGRVINRALHIFNENILVEKAKNALLTDNQATFIECVRASGLSSLTALQNYTYPYDETQGVLLAYNLSKQFVPTGAYRIHGGGFAGTLLAFIPQQESKYYVSEMQKVFGKEYILKLHIRPDGPAPF